MKVHDLSALLRRAAAAIETPDDLSRLDVEDLLMELGGVADALDDGSTTIEPLLRE